MNKKEKADKAFKAKIAASDARIAEAVEVLASHHRGIQTAKELAKFLKGPAGGLDGQGLDALLVLVTEFKAGRRDFTSQLANLKGGE